MWPSPPPLCLQLRVGHGAREVPPGVLRAAGGHRVVLRDSGEVRPSDLGAAPPGTPTWGRAAPGEGAMPILRVHQPWLCPPSAP